MPGCRPCVNKLLVAPNSAPSSDIPRHWPMRDLMAGAEGALAGGGAVRDVADCLLRIFPCKRLLSR